MAVVSEPESVKTDSFEAMVTANAGIAEIWFRERPAPWRSTSGLGRLQRTTRDMITLALQVDIHIELQKVLMKIDGRAIDVDVRPPPPPKKDRFKAIRNIDFRAYVEVHDHLDVQTLPVRTNRETPTTTVRVPCVLIDFNPSLGVPTNFPRLEVRLNETDLRNANAVKLMMAAAFVRDGTGGGEAAFAALVAELTARLRKKIPEQLSAQEDWRIADTGKALLFADTSGEPMSIKNVEVRTLDDSIVIGIDYLARRGVIFNVADSTLRGRTGRPNLDDLGITVNNRMLLAGVIRPALIEKFSSVEPGLGGAPDVIKGLKMSDFDPGQYCALRRPVTGAKLSETQEGTLHSLLAFVNRDSEVQVLLSFSADVFPGATLHATLDLRLAFRVTTELNGARQSLRITPRLANPGTAVVSKRVDIAWWAYVAVGVLIPFGIGLLLVAIVDGIVMELIASGQLADMVSKISLPAQDSPALLPVTLTSPALGLNNADAPPMPTRYGGLLRMVWGAAAHDLYVGARYTRLPDPLAVTFQIPDSADPGARLDGIGGLLADGRTEWGLPIDDAVTLVDAGHTLEVRVPPAAPPVRVTKAARDGVPYLRTESDDRGVNNLGNLPKRIPAASSTLGPGA